MTPRLRAARAAIVWFSGLPGAGKTTLARLVQSELSRLGVDSELIDSDEVRADPSHPPDYSNDGRDEFYEGLTERALALSTRGTVALVAATAPKRRYRDAVRSLAHDFILVHVATPIEVCSERDPKGLYRRARAGEIDNLPGVGTPFESPENPEFTTTVGGDRPLAVEVARAIAAGSERINS